MKKTFLDILYEFAGEKEARKDAKKVVTKDPQTGKVISVEYEAKNMLAFKNKQYNDLLAQFKDDKEFQNQVYIIRKNNVFYLNRMYSIIKTRDPNLENLQMMFSKTKNDKDFFSYLNSFIVPFKSLLHTTQSIESEKAWEDLSYIKAMSQNNFEIVEPSGGVLPTAENVMIEWEKNKRSIRQFNDDMKQIVDDHQTYDNLRDTLEQDAKKINKLLQEKDSKVIKKEIEDSEFIIKFPSFISSLKDNTNPDKDSKPVIVATLNKVKNNPEFENKIFKVLLGEDNSNEIGFFLKDKDIYSDIVAVSNKLKVIRDAYFKYSKDSKVIMDSSFIKGDNVDYVRASLIENIDFIVGGNQNKSLQKKIEELSMKFFELKKFIKTLDQKKDGQYIEVPINNINSNEVKKSLSSVTTKDLNVLFNDILQSIIKLKAIQRVCGFIDLYASGQFHNLIDVDDIDINADDLDDYYVMVSIVPEDVRNQSTHQFWTSCQNLINGGTGLNKWVGTGTLLGNIVCFLCALDWSSPLGGAKMKTVTNISNKPIKNKDAIESIEQFKEIAEQGIQGTKKLAIRKFLRSYAIRPIGRVLIKTFDLSEENGITTLKPEVAMKGGAEEEVSTLKYVDRLYTPKKDDVKDMKNFKGDSYVGISSKYATKFYTVMKSLANRLNINVKVGDYRLRDKLYDDGTNRINFSSVIKDYKLGKEINFSRLKTSDILELLYQDKNFLRYKTFRHALFSKDDVDGTLDLTGTQIVSLEPMHPTNLPSSSVNLPNDKAEDIKKMENSWMVNDDFIYDRGDKKEFSEPLTKSELQRYQNA